MPAPIESADYGNGSCPASKRIEAYTWFLAISWTVLIGVSCYWSISELQRVLHKVAMTEARVAIERDLLYRRWNSSHGGVYVPVTEKTPPNPYMPDFLELNVRTKSGKTLTLVNPAYMTSQVYGLARQQDSFAGRGHLASLKPLRPKNFPDSWEEKVLRSFEQGAGEGSAVVEIDGQPYMRLMRPFFTEHSCLKCHVAQGARVGEVRGGLSVSIPIRPLIDATHTQIAGTAVTHGVLWLLGLGMVGFGGARLCRSACVQQQIETELYQRTLQMENEIAARQKVQEALQESQVHLQVVADYASNWEYWRLPDESFRYFSPCTTAFTGYTPEEFMSDKELLSNILHSEDRELFRVHTHEVDENGKVEPIELRIIRKDGEVRWIGHVCRQVFNKDGQSWGWRASNQDITNRKLMEDKLYEQAKQLEEEVAQREASQEELELLNRSLEERVNAAVSELRNKDQMLIQQSRLAAMGEMINNIAHQWRQPLNNIGLIVQNLSFSFDSGTGSREEVESETGKAMAIIMHMSRTIDDFRNFFRADKEKSDFCVNKAVKRSLEFVRATLENHNIQVEIEADQEVVATGYPNEYSQVLLNIISNASDACIERSVAEPRIIIHITLKNSRSVVCVRDNCGGIPDDVMPKIFDPYFTTRDPDKGSGIGLYMSKVIIEQNMGGQLTAHNVEGGAEFKIEV